MAAVSPPLSSGDAVSSLDAAASPVASSDPSSSAPPFHSQRPRQHTPSDKPHPKKKPTWHFVRPSSHGRQDVLSLKQQIADALGENGPLYWDALKEFVCGKLNRQEFDFYANLYLSREHAHLHNAFILSTVHNAQTSVPPPMRHRTPGWSKRRRGKDGEDDDDPFKQRLKNDLMSLTKADRDRIKAIHTDERPQRLAPRVSRPPPLPLPADQLPSNFSTDYSRGLLAPLCSDLKELPNPATLHARMTSIALENGLLGGVGDDVVSAMLFALESYIKSAISSTISKRRVNRCVGVSLATEEPVHVSSPLPHLPGPDTDSIRLADLAFSFQLTPYVLVENPMNAERLTALMSESEEEGDDLDDEDAMSQDDGLGESSSDERFEL